MGHPNDSCESEVANCRQLSNQGKTEEEEVTAETVLACTSIRNDIPTAVFHIGCEAP